ncbi:MAG TPA: hypothetical protein VFW96_03985 [Thermomicrobiales bacterium]|nr:hypothetical protein [Thermomicrobiales bacterium]
MARTEPQTIIVVYDGQVLRPEGPLDLEVNARYRVTIAPMASEEDQRTAWDVLDELAGTVEAPPEAEGDLFDLLDQLAGTLEMPEDWATEHDHYLYGTPKRGSDPEE